MITTFENRCVLKHYLIVLIPIFVTTYNEKKRFKNTWEFYITNWSYSYKVIIFYTIYQRMRSKGTSWDGPRLKYVTLNFFHFYAFLVQVAVLFSARIR